MAARNGKLDVISEKDLKNKRSIKLSYPKTLNILEKWKVFLIRMTNRFFKSKNQP